MTNRLIRTYGLSGFWNAGMWLELSQEVYDSASISPRHAFPTSTTSSLAFQMTSVGIIGSGQSGLITAYTLYRDGFNVEILTRDVSIGGVWSKARVYPNLRLNNVHGEYRFSNLPMDLPPDSEQMGGRLTGYGMQSYMETFADRFLKGRIRFQTEVLQISRDDQARLRWRVSIRDIKDGSEKTLTYDKIVLCTGGCSTPKIPDVLSQSAAHDAKFAGMVFHSIHFRARLDELLARTKGDTNFHSSGSSPSIVIVGGGKSAQDIAAYLANEGRKVSIVFEKADPFTASAKPLPGFIRRSRLLSIFSPYIELNTWLEWFLHKTWVGSKIVSGMWNSMATGAFEAAGVPEGSPLRHTHSIFWSIRTNDEAVPRRNGFHALVNEGKIDLIAPTRVEKYGADGRSVVLKNGTTLRADVVILATGYSSSWDHLFDDHTSENLGLMRHPPMGSKTYAWYYTTLVNPPSSHPQEYQWASSIYRGLVPVKSLLRHDFAVNGGIFSPNNGYTCEVASHWISSYFLGDSMRFPSTLAEGYEHTERNAAWMRRRYPDQLLWMNESCTTSIAWWTWPQVVDELLEDMGLRSMRSGGNWLTWPFKVIDLSEIATLKEERDARQGR